MEWQDLGAAISLLLIFEGIVPFLMPHRVRTAAFTILQFNDQTIRVLGLLSMGIGIGVLYLVR